jgi:outer membrane protein OmpA-like peptidoglycan-associated protein
MKTVFGMAIAIVCCGFAVASEGDNLEHPLIRPFPGSVLIEDFSHYREYDVYEFSVTDPETGKTVEKPVKGEYRRLHYEVQDENGKPVPNISQLEFRENYRAAAEEKGGEVLYEDRVRMTFTVPREDGGITYCELTGNVGRGQQRLNIVDEKPFNRSMKFGPKEMKTALDKDNRVALYDILFEYDKATLQVDSQEQLGHVVVLLKENPDLVVEVQGHTDGEGSEDYNLELSQRRAETVVDFLTLFGIDPARLTAKGYGESKPVESNDTEEGRAKNRRVELVKRSDNE